MKVFQFGLCLIQIVIMQILIDWTVLIFKIWLIEKLTIYKLFMTNREALDKLKELSCQLDKVDYSDIVNILKESIRKIPVPIARMPPNTPIDRVRKNVGENPFTDVHNQLSYIKDQNVIDNYLTEFGRANEPHQSMFYGAIESSLIGHQRITALAETSELLQNPDAVDFAGELYTVSRWRNTSELFLAEIVFSQDAIDTNPDIKNAFAKQSEFAKQVGADDIDFYLDFLVFISDQFARPKTGHDDYKISTAYTNLILTNPNIHGIAYPSVQTKYQGQNVVFPPDVVDQYLVVEILSMQRLYKNKMRSYLNNVKNCLAPNDCLDDIVWTELNPQFVATIEKIHASLNGED